MIIGFNKQFPDKINEGTKKHTLREDEYDRWHTGMKMHMSTGVRSKNYKCFKLDRCNGIQRIEIVYFEKRNRKFVFVFVDDLYIGGYYPDQDLIYGYKILPLPFIEDLNSPK